MGYLHKLLISMFFIATFGFGNQNQINQLLKTIDKTKNLTGFIPLLEKQSQNSFGHTATTSPLTVHNSRDDFTSILVDSSLNGYSFISDVTDPLYWEPGVGFVLSYRQFQGYDASSGSIGAAQSEDGLEWFTEQNLNECYPAGLAGGQQCEPSLPTTNGYVQGRYPSSCISGDENSIRPTVIWNEETNSSYGGGENGGYPLYAYDQDEIGEFSQWQFPFNVNSGCITIPCDPPDLWIPQIQLVNNESYDNTLMTLYQQGKVTPSQYYWIKSSFYANGYFVLNDPVQLFDFSNNEIISEYAGRPKFHINDDGIGYFVFSGYGDGYDSEGSLQSHTFFILKTTDNGESWGPAGETFNNGSYGFIPDENLNLTMLDAGLLGGTVQDSAGNDVTLDQAFMGYNYQVFTDEYNGLHIIATALPKSSESDSLYVGSPGAGYYHLYNSDPSNPGNWTATMIRDMSDSYKVQVHPDLPTWQYLYADVAMSYDGGVMWLVTSAIRELIPVGNNEYTYDDLDLFGSVSFDNGLIWGDLGNLTDTPSGGAYGANFELHPHLATKSEINECYLTFQMPVSDDNQYLDDVLNRIYFAKVGLEGLSGQGTVTINEIMQNPSAVGDDNGEWFEIINDGNLPISVTGWSIKDAGDDNHVIEDLIVFSPGEYLVFGNNSNPNANGGVTVDYQYSDVSLGNGTDELILVDPSGTVIDSVGWDNGSTFPDPNGASMALLDTSSDNSVGSNWQESTTPYGNGDLGTPGLPNFLSDITLDSIELNFGMVGVNESSVLSLTISNEGNGPLQLDSLYTNSTLFTLSFTDSLIETSAILQVIFTPIEFGPATGSLFILSNDPDESSVEVPLSGFGYYPSPDIELESTTLDFGGIMDGLTGLEFFKVYNIGETALEIDTVYCTEYFLVMPGNGIVNAGDTLALEVTFAPDDEASFDGTLTIVAGNDPDEDTLTVSLSGTGTQQAPIMELSDDSLYFGIVVAGQTVTRQTTIHNMGMQDLEIEELNMAGSELFTTDFSDATVEPGDSVDIAFQFISAEQISDATANATVVGSGVADQIITLYAGEVLTAENNFIPSEYILYQNHPNPFNPITTLRYDLPEDGLVNITIYDMVGRVVKTMVNTQQNAGFKSVRWNATNDNGAPVSAGLYLYTIQAGEFRQTKKMVLLK